MPIVAIEIVADAGDAVEQNLAQSLANAVGRALGSPPGETWVRLRSIEHNRYAENEAAVGLAGLPVFVTVLNRQMPHGAELQAEITALTGVIARAAGRPAARVHIEYAPAAVGRVAFGGALVQ